MEDTSNLEFFLAIASYFGKFPYRISCKKLWGFYVHCWCIFSVFLNISGVIFEIRNRNQYYFHILPIIVYVQWALLNVQCSLNAIKYVEKWEKVHSAFSKYENINPNLFKKSYLSRYIFIVAIVAVNMTFLIRPTGFSSQLDLRLALLVCWRFHGNMLGVIYTVILENLTLLKKRYKEIREEVSMWHQRQMMPKDRLANLKERYRILHEISTSIDEIFGKIILLLVANSFSITIDMIGLILTMKLENATLGTVKFLTHGIIMVITAAYTLCQYDSIEKIGKDIVKLYCVHEAYNGAYTVSLVKYFDELSPRFTADGYFALNKTVVTAMLAGIATYIVVLLQLKPN